MAFSLSYRGYLLDAPRFCKYTQLRSSEDYIKTAFKRHATVLAMSTIHLLDSDTSEFRGLVTPENDTFVELFEQFDGTPISESWAPFTVHYDPDLPDLPIGDFPSISLPHIPVFSRRAVDVLSSLLISSGELLPLRCGEIEYFAFNVTHLVDALNVKTSDIVYYSSGRIMDVKNYVLETERVTFAPIFKLRETPLMDVFVSDEFVTAVNDANLKGFIFEPVTLIG